jgi:hypothetical protein
MLMIFRRKKSSLPASRQRLDQASLHRAICGTRLVCLCEIW